MTSQYELTVKKELSQWEDEILSKSSIVERLSRSMQKRIDAIIPKKVHETLTKAMEMAVKSVLTGINLLPVSRIKLAKAREMSLEEIDRQVEEIINRYKKLGAASGAGTGAGGILMMAVDYPALLSLELKMLQEIAHSFGYDVKKRDERLFMLKVFLLAFSGDENRKKVYLEIRDWQKNDRNSKEIESTALNWHEIYTEYKESIEFKKMLQIIPGIGAVVGAWANYSVLEELGQTARNAYRLRYFSRRKI